MAIQKFFFLLLIVPAVVLAGPTFKCNNDPEPINVKLDKCTNDYCEVKRNEPANMELTFKPKKTVTTLSGSIHAQVAGMWMPWMLGNQSKVCDNLLNGKKCPVEQDQEVTYKLNITIPRIAPVGTKVLVEIKVTDNTRTSIVCTRVQILVAA